MVFGWRAEEGFVGLFLGGAILVVGDSGMILGCISVVDGSIESGFLHK